MIIDTHSPQLAVVFVGQGSQSVDMLSELSIAYPIVKQTFQQASDALNFDLWHICQDKNKLNDTQYTQPALLTASMAIWQVLQANIFNEHYQPQLLAGHSLGEYSALCASGVLSLSDAVQLVHKRGQLMQSAVVDQAVMMSAILGLEDGQVIELCEQVMLDTDHAVVNPANFNSQGQVVIAGNQIGVKAVMKQVKELGKKALPLKVSVPSHCQLMDSASEQFAQVLSDTQFHAPTIPIIQNRHARIENTTEDMIKALIEQLNHPVCWSATMGVLSDQQIDLLIECGSGKVLTNLAKRQRMPITCYPSDTADAIATLQQALAINT